MVRRLATLLPMLASCYAGSGGGDGGGDGGEGGENGSGSTAGGTLDEGEAEADSGAPPDPESVIDEAERELPTYLDLHTKVIARTCTPDEGVCHNDKEYPDLHTPQSMLGAISQPCNIAVDDDSTMFDGCETAGDRFKFLYGPNGEWATEIAWIEFAADGSTATLELREAIPMAMGNPAEPESFELSRVFPDETLVLENFYGNAFYEAGETWVMILGYADLDDGRTLLLEQELVVGDPNQNGIYGAEATQFTLIQPGDPDVSYLLGRLLGSVPGTPMPLANQPLSSAEMIGLTCWIEGLAVDGAANVYAAIDYAGCEAAAAFGEPQPDSGHALAGDVQPIFDQFCTAGGCHSHDMPAEGLDLTAGYARDELLATSTQDAMKYRVVPGNPTDSYLMLKLQGKGAMGLQMPRTAYGEGEPLDEERLDVIERWIIAGAPDD